MAIKFNKSVGKAIKSEIDSYDFKFGDNTLRIVGDILPRYVYWIKGENDKNIPFECLEFDRDAEAFLRKEKDWVKVFHPGKNCTWSYLVNAVVPDEAAECGYKVVVCNLKKKMWEQVISAARTLGDPTDVKKGWDIKVSKKKTGALAFNVEYQLLALECKNRPLNEGELKAVKDMTVIDEKMPRPTPEAQKELLDRLASGETPANTDEENVEKEFQMN